MCEATDRIAAMQPGRVWCGLLLMGAAGALLDRAWNVRTGDPWLTGTLTAAAGVFVLASVLLLVRGQPASGAKPATALDKSQGESSEAPPFLLGDLLVNRFSLVTYDQLAQGLARQRGTSKRIGEVLVEMGLLTEDDLEMVLEEQRLLRTVWQELNAAAGSGHAEHAPPPPSIAKRQSESGPAA